MPYVRKIIYCLRTYLTSSTMQSYVLKRENTSYFTHFHLSLGLKSGRQNRLHEKCGMKHQPGLIGAAGSHTAHTNDSTIRWKGVIHKV